MVRLPTAIHSGNGLFGYGAIAHSHLQRSMFRVFPWINQSDIFILN